jgi:hypothetical protein
MPQDPKPPQKGAQQQSQRDPKQQPQRDPQRNAQQEVHGEPQQQAQKEAQRMQPSQKPGKPQEMSGTERGRDEMREGGGPRYGGGAWDVADERGERRFGHARNDDADPSEMARGEANNDDDEAVNAADPELAAAEQNREIESGGDREGFGRGEKPRKPKSREK